MCMGSLTPIMTSDTEFVSFLGDEVIKYTDYKDMRKKVLDFFEGRIDVERILEAAESYVKRNCPEVIAGKFIELFSKL